MTIPQAKWFVSLMCAVPILFATLQILLFVCVFNYDTPVIMKQKGDFIKLSELMKKMYIPMHVEERINAIDGAVNRKKKGTIKTVTYKQVCCSRFYRKSTLIGVIMAMLQ